MKTKITCPCCGQEYDIDKSIIGQTVKCEESETTFTASIVLGKKSPRSGKKKKIIAVVVCGVILAVAACFYPKIKSEWDYKKGMDAFINHRSDEAFNYFKKAAAFGHPGAQYELGYYYSKRDSSHYDEAEAAKWYHKSAEQGFCHAQSALGYSYLKGELDEKDEREALFWFQQAAEQGDATSQYILALCYSQGLLVPKNVEEAVFLIQKLKEIYDDFFEVEKMYPLIIQSGNVEYSIPILEEAGNMGFSEAYYRIGKCYQTGNGVEPNLSKAKQYFENAAELGHRLADSELIRIELEEADERVRRELDRPIRF